MLLVRKRGEAGWRAPKQTAYAEKVALQALIEQSPEPLPGSNGVPNINQHATSGLQFLAVELQYIADDGFEILLPAVWRGEYPEQGNDDHAEAAVGRAGRPDGTGEGLFTRRLRGRQAIV